MIYIFNEIKYILHAHWNRVLILWLPIVITIYFSLLFSNGIVNNIPTVIVDNDNTSTSRALTQEFYNSQYFNLVSSYNSWFQGYDMVLADKAQVIITIPNNFNTNIKRGIPSEVAVYVNASNLAISSAALKRASEIILAYNSYMQIKTLEGLNFTPVMAENIALPLKINYIELNNESGNFADFLIWGLIGAIVHFPVMLLSTVSLFDIKNPAIFKTVIGKLIAISLLGLIVLLVCILTASIIFPLSFRGSFLQAVFLSLIFLTTVSAFGLLISSFSPNKLIATQLGIVVVLPALILSGYTWPLTEFPWFIKILGYAEPLTHYVTPLRKISLSGFARSYWSSIFILSLMGIAYTLLASLLYKGRVKTWQKQAS